MKRVLLALALPLLVACSVPAGPVPATPTADDTVGTKRDVDLGDGILLTVAGPGTDWAPAANDCTDRLRLFTTPDGDYQVAMINAGCTANPVAGNGFHGYFVAPPAKAAVETFATPAGDTRLFSDSYFECTNSCTTGTDEVALLRAGDHVLQVIAVASPSGRYQDRSRADLKTFLQRLHRP